MPIVKITGDISHREITELIRENYPGRKIKISSAPPSSARSASCGNLANVEGNGDVEYSWNIRRERPLTTTPREEILDSERSSSENLSSRTTISRTSSGMSTTDSFDDVKGQAALQYEIERLYKVLDEKNAELSIQAESSKKAFAAVQHANKQQQHLFDDFVALRKKFDEQREVLKSVLWEYTSQFHPALSYIPKLENMNTFKETGDVVGQYRILETLGEGEFATVKACHRIPNEDRISGDHHQQQLAIKIIKKDRILSFIGLTRVNMEIEILKKLRSKFTVQLFDAFQTATNLYIVTEKGGVDMFEFFEKYPNGVQENWAKNIVSHFLRAVKAVHDRGFSHRDLKPENILINFDAENGKCIELKLCDFGLCTRSTSMLRDFCGSPGFFAPELIIDGVYDGKKADVWSIGCVILELILGHEKFCEHWMVAYDYERLQDSELFTKSIKFCVSNLETVFEKDDCNHMSQQLSLFLMRLLEFDPSQRPTLNDLHDDPWLSSISLMEDGIDDDDDSEDVKDDDINVVSTPSGFVAPLPHRESPPPNTPRLETRGKLKGSCSSRERKMMDEFNQGKALKIGVSPNDDFAMYQLPPLDPGTPSIKSALKKMFKLSPSSSQKDGKNDGRSESLNSSDDGVDDGIGHINLSE